MAHSEMRYLQVWYAKKSMLSIHYVSIMMQIFYVDWQQHWKCNRTIYWCKCTWQTNGINKTVTSDRLDYCWQLDFQWHRRGIELVFKSQDCYIMFHIATIFCCNICIYCLQLHQADNLVEEFYFFKPIFFISSLFRGGGGGLTSIWWGSTQLQFIYYLVPCTDL